MQMLQVLGFLIDFFANVWYNGIRYLLQTEVLELIFPDMGGGVK